MMRWATVTDTTAAGVWVMSAWLPGPTGPLPVSGAPAVGDPVLVVRTDDGELAVVAGGRLSALPGAGIDNTVPRFDGTTGALQGSGVTLADDNALTVPGLLIVERDGMSLTLKASDSPSSYSGMRLTRGNLRRWDINKSDYPAETGTGDTGSNLEIARYSDNQAFLGHITYWRSTGKLTLDGVGSAAGLEFGSSGPRIMAGAGSPESVVAAPAGSVWLQTDATLGPAALWWKGSGSGNTGWLNDSVERITQRNASTTLALTDLGRNIEMNVGANTTITVPPNSSVPFPIGSRIRMWTVTNTYTTTLVAGSGVMIDKTPGLKFTAAWSPVTLIKRQTDQWIAFGALSA